MIFFSVYGQGPFIVTKKSKKLMGKSMLRLEYLLKIAKKLKIP